MAKTETYVHAFNAGVHDKIALPRVDLARMRLATEVQTNMLCKAVGPAFLRPGLEYLSASGICRMKEFVFGATDAALLEFTDLALQVRLDDVLITRPAVTAGITNGAFNSSTGWTLTATAGATAAIAGGLLALAATARGSLASCSQAVTVGQLGVEHALRIQIPQGPVTFRVGTTLGLDDLIAETQLATGVHSLAFTPNVGQFFVLFTSDERPAKYVSDIQVEPAGVMSVPTPYPVSTLSRVRFSQSADVVFTADGLRRQRRIERRSLRSWSVVEYTSDNGPFTVGRTKKVKLKTTVTEGNGSLISDAAFFNPNHVGALFKLSGNGATQTVILGGEAQFSDAFRVTGVDRPSDGYSDRVFSYAITGTWVGTLQWFRSFDGPDSGFQKYKKDTSSTTTPITANVSAINGDQDDNAIVYYKLGFDDGLYTSGAATVAIAYAGGGGFGICRVTAYTSPTQVEMEVMRPFVSFNYTDDWNEGEWSDAQIWPSAVAFSDGRLFWSGRDRLWGSVSDAFDSFDDEVEGDSGPISRSIATGGINDTQWLMSLQRMIIGTEGAISSAKSSSLDEPLTPTNISVKDSSTTGVAPIEAIKIDSRGLFVERAGNAILEVVFDGTKGDYVATQLSKLTTDLFSSGVKAVAIQRRPDTRIWIVNNDGGCVCCVYEPDQEVLAFIPIVTDGAFESVAVLPSLVQDRVYFSVERNGVRSIEKMALDSEVKPTTLCKTVDSFKVATPGSATVTGATHLTGRQVAVWADGAPLSGLFTVDGSGQFTLPQSAAQVVYGLPYTGRIKTSRLAYGAPNGTSMLKKRTVDEVGLILTDFVRAGLTFGHSFDDHMYPMPQMANGSVQPAIVLSDIQDEEPFNIGGQWDLDSRLCMEVSSPNTATILGLVLSITTN